MQQLGCVFRRNSMSDGFPPAEVIAAFPGYTPLELARTQGGFTIFSIVDALTRLSQRVSWVGDRAELDARIGALLALVA